MAQNIFSDLIPGQTSDAAPASAARPMTTPPLRQIRAPQPKVQDPLEVERVRLSQEANARAAADQAAQMEKQRRDALEWSATHNPDGSLKPTAAKGDDSRKAAIQNANLDALVSQINRTQKLYNQGLRDEAIPIIGSLWDYLPTEGNRQFDTAAAGLAEQGLSAFRVPGVGAQSDTELRQFVQANKPAASDYDASIEEKLLQLRNRVDSNRAALGLPSAQWEGLTGSNDEVPPTPAPGPLEPQGPGSDDSDGTITPPSFSPGSPQMVPNTSGVRNEDDPALSGIRDEYARRIAASQNASEIVSYLRSAGVTDPEVLRTAARQAAFRQRYPNVPLEQYDFEQVDDRVIPISDISQAITDFGANPVGAYFANAGQFLSGNTLDNLASDPERARAAFEVLRAENPNASALGEVSGGIMAGLLGEAALARAGMSAGLGRGVLADAAAGGANTAGAADEGDRLGAFAKGAAAAGVGSATGSLTARGLSRALSPTGGSVSDLYEAGVRPTLGQRVVNANEGRGVRGVAGRAINAAEEALQSVPVVGSAIRGAREEARDQFQIGAFNQALAEIGEQLPHGAKAGTAPHKIAQQAFDRAYDKARSGMRLVPDESLTADLAALSDDISTLGPAAQKRLKAIMGNAVNSKLVNGEMAGDNYKRAMSDLGRFADRFGKSTASDDQAVAYILKGVRDAMDSAARRHSDPEAVQLLDAADTGYAKLVRLEDAARRRGGDDGTFSPTQLNAAIQNMEGSVRSRRFLRGDALMQDYANQGMSLVDRMPNSGTADRMMAGGALAGGAAYLEPTTLGLLGAIGTAYAPGVRKATKGVMAPAGPARKAISEQLRRRARLIGAATGSTAALGAQGGTPSP